MIVTSAGDAESSRTGGVSNSFILPRCPGAVRRMKRTVHYGALPVTLVRTDTGQRVDDGCTV